MNDYDSIAQYYYFLSHLLFGKNLEKAQTAHLQQLPNKGKLLVIGGGGGKFLTQLIPLKPHLSIIFIEKSEKMMAQATDKVRGFEHRVTLIHGTEKDIPADYYDAIITFFFLDIFNTRNRFYHFFYLNAFLKKGGVWLIADFSPPKSRKQRTIERLMFRFLKITTKLESDRIEEYNTHFDRKEFELLVNSTYYNSFIFSSAYKKRRVQ